MHARPSRSELIELINQARLEQDISVRGAARISGVPASTAQGWLGGRHFPTPALRPRFVKLVAQLGLEQGVEAIAVGFLQHGLVSRHTRDVGLFDKRIGWWKQAGFNQNGLNRR